MIVTVIRCDRCKKLVDADPPDDRGTTEGYYSAPYWAKYFNPGEEHVCDACLWADPTFIEVYGVIPQ